MSKINLYTLNSCMPCKKMKHLLDDLNIEYNEISMEDKLDDDNYNHILGVPYIEVSKSDGTQVQHYGAIGKDHLMRLLEDE